MSQFLPTFQNTPCLTFVLPKAPINQLQPQAEQKNATHLPLPL